jgi:hypothetical protein
LHHIVFVQRKQSSAKVVVSNVPGIAIAGEALADPIHFSIGRVSLAEAARRAFVRPMPTASLSPKQATASEPTTVREDRNADACGALVDLTVGHAESRLAYGSQLGLEGIPVECRILESSALPRAFNQPVRLAGGAGLRGLLTKVRRWPYSYYGQHPDPRNRSLNLQTR